MTNIEERRLYETYLDMCPTTNENKNEEDIEEDDNCEHIKTMMDKSNYYLKSLFLFFLFYLILYILLSK